MADQNITALPVATSPASSDQLLIVGATEEKLIDYEKLADAILAKLTSKTFALDQGTKSLVAALNELNSNRLKEYNWRAYDDIISAMNAEKEAILIQGSSVFAAATNGGHPYMIILSVPESRDAIGVYVDYFKPTVTAFRYKNDSFEIII